MCSSFQLMDDGFEPSLLQYCNTRFSICLWRLHHVGCVRLVTHHWSLCLHATTLRSVNWAEAQDPALWPEFWPLRAAPTSCDLFIYRTLAPLRSSALELQIRSLSPDFPFDLPQSFPWHHCGSFVLRDEWIRTIDLDL